MVFENKRLFIIVLGLFSLLNGLKSQDKDLQKANQLLSVAQERNRVASEELEEVKSRRLRLEEDLADLQDNTKSNTKTEKKKLENEIKLLRNKEEELLRRRKYANNLLLDVTDILQTSPKKRAKFIAEYEERFGEIALKNVHDNQEVTNIFTPSVTTPKTNTDPIAQLETQSSNQTISEAIPTDSTQSQISNAEPIKKKKESSKKAKSVENKDKKVAVTNKTVSKKQKEIKPKVKNEAPPMEVAEASNTSEAKEKKHASKPKSTKQAAEKPVAAKKPSDAKSRKKKEISTLPNTDTEAKTDVVASESMTQQNDIIKEPEPQIQTNIEPKSESKKKKKETSSTKSRAESSKSAIIYKKYDPKEDVMLNTPMSSDCHLVFDGIDNFTGKKKQETESVILFAHTDDFMRATLKDKDFVTCAATATRVEGSRTIYLNLTITIQSKEAQRTFGFLDRGSLIIFRFINGKKVSLATSKTDIGAVDIDKGTTTFHAQLAILETVELTQSELDAVRISWSIGYEDYEIFDMDVLRNLFKCLDKK